MEAFSESRLVWLAIFVMSLLLFSSLSKSSVIASNDCRISWQNPVTPVIASVIAVLSLALLLFPAAICPMAESSS